MTGRKNTENIGTYVIEYLNRGEGRVYTIQSQTLEAYDGGGEGLSA